MTSTSVNTVAVLGAGVMGQGIAYVASNAGFRVQLHDLDKEAISKGIEGIKKMMASAVEKYKMTSEGMSAALNLIEPLPDLSGLQGQVVCEAVIENLEAKIKLLRQVQKIAPEAVLATNTSSIPITQIGKGLDDASMLAGLHFFNPAHIMKLVEVVSGLETRPEVPKMLLDLTEKLGKTGVVVKDSPGFIVNRVARHYYLESLRLLEDEISSVQDIDKLLESVGFRMGPFRLMDLIGVDTNLDVSTTVYNQFYQETKFRPSRLQRQLVDAGHHGRKSGKGFYDY